MSAFRDWVQILIVFVGGSAFQGGDSMSGRDWGISIALGVMSIPIGFGIRMIPNKPCERFFILARIQTNCQRLILKLKRSDGTMPLNV